jgi:hypothetical protein
VNISIKAAEKNTSFIRGIKGQISGINNLPDERFHAGRIIDDVINLLEFKFKKSSCELETNINDNIYLFGKPGRINKIYY